MLKFIRSMNDEIKNIKQCLNLTLVIVFPVVQLRIKKKIDKTREK